MTREEFNKPLVKLINALDFHLTPDRGEALYELFQSLRPEVWARTCLIIKATATNWPGLHAWQQAVKAAEDEAGYAAKSSREPAGGHSACQCGGSIGLPVNRALVDRPGAFYPLVELPEELKEAMRAEKLNRVSQAFHMVDNEWAWSLLMFRECSSCGRAYGMAVEDAKIVDRKGTRMVGRGQMAELSADRLAEMGIVL